MYHQVFTVKGKGAFPIDMLRLDYCWPHNEEDSKRVFQKGIRTIELVRRIDREGTVPAAGHWLSYGWTVKEIVTSK